MIYANAGYYYSINGRGGGTTREIFSYIRHFPGCPAIDIHWALRYKLSATPIFSQYVNLRKVRSIHRTNDQTPALPSLVLG